MFDQLDEKGEWRLAPTAFVGGMDTNHFFVKSGKSIFRIGVLIKPGMVQHLVREEILLLKGKNTDLRDIWGKEVKT